MKPTEKVIQMSDNKYTKCSVYKKVSSPLGHFYGLLFYNME